MTLNQLNKLYNAVKKIEIQNGYVANFYHAYITNSFDVMTKTYKKKHACLYFGFWCWTNAITDPLLAIKYIYRKLGSGLPNS